ncbi:MAG TPA: 2-hydroxy-3-oxopropionate reductase, partial [Acidimicrobiaceae bacterium]|nr:2-hydroxy-3-oxopropionate reductase [Acidimicrobiaceae bacterium]
FIDNTTASADIARVLYDAARARGLHFIDAPVSGGQAGAEGGKLTVMCGGDAAAYDQAKPLMSCYGARVTHMGSAGAGQLTKMVNQICIAGLVQGLSEGINFAQRAGLDVGGVVDTISKGAAGSWQMENRAQTMADGVFDYGFALDWMRKDLRICFEEAAANGSVLPVTEIVDGYYEQLQELGLGRWDTSTLIHLLRQE